MANLPEDIDQYFSQRFSDVKDHSIDPSGQWDMFEQSLDAALKNDVDASGKGRFTGKAVLAAASAAVLVSIAVWTYLAPTGEDGQSSIQTETGPADQNNSGPEETYVSTSVSNTNGNAPVTVAHSEDSPHAASSRSASNTIPEEFVEALQKLASNDEPGMDAMHASTRSFAALEEERDNVMEMNLLGPFQNRNGILDRAGANSAIGFDRWSTRTFMYFKAGARSGFTNNARFKEGVPVNFYFGLGYGIRVNSQWSIAAEAVLMRKSGQSLERTRQHHIHNVNQFQVPSAGDVVPSNFLVHKSFIATRLDVFQAPVLINYSPGTSRKIAFGAGAYVEYLIRAENDIYFIYDDTYVSSLGVGETNTLEGLTRIRYGALANFTYNWMDKVNFSLRGMVLLNDGAKEENGLKPIRGSQLPIDVQLGVNYLLVH